MGKKNTFTYKDGEPFRVLLFNNTLTTRFIVSPQLSWILKGELCQKCNPSEKTQETKINLENFKNDFSKKFGKGVAKRAIELKLWSQGCYSLQLLVELIHHQKLACQLMIQHIFPLVNFSHPDKILHPHHHPFLLNSKLLF